MWNKVTVLLYIIFIYNIVYIYICSFQSVFFQLFDLFPFLPIITLFFKLLVLYCLYFLRFSFFFFLFFNASKCVGILFTKISSDYIYLFSLHKFIFIQFFSMTYLFNYISLIISFSNLLFNFTMSISIIPYHWI